MRRASAPALPPSSSAKIPPRSSMSKAKSPPANSSVLPVGCTPLPPASPPITCCNSSATSTPTAAWTASSSSFGFHPVNVGRLVSNRPGLVACTPAGCMELLRRNKIPIEGANAVVLGRSDIVGKPMALLLLHANATVTICHSKTRDLPDVIRRADILVAAIGKAGYVQPDWIKPAAAGNPGAAVIDVGTNKVTDAAEAAQLLRNFPERLEKFRAKGNALIGDVHSDAIQVASALSPVPGGVGPMTITMLMSNTVKAARLRRASSAAVARP